MPLGIIELLTRIGENNVRLQNLFDGDVDLTETKHGTRVAFTLVAHLKKMKSDLGKKRDEMRAVLDEYQEILDTVDRAEDALETAIDALSEYV